MIARYLASTDSAALPLLSAHKISALPVERAKHHEIDGNIFIRRVLDVFGGAQG